MGKIVSNDITHFVNCLNFSFLNIPRNNTNQSLSILLNYCIGQYTI